MADAPLRTPIKQVHRKEKAEHDTGEAESPENRGGTDATPGDSLQ